MPVSNHMENRQMPNPQNCEPSFHRPHHNAIDSNLESYEES